MVEWIEQGWIYLAAAIGAITLFWNFTTKTLKEIRDVLLSPVNEIKTEVSGLTSALTDIKDHDSLVESSLLSMQRHTILEFSEECLLKGFATLEEKQTLAELYKTYKSLKGNSFVSDLVDQVEALPLSKPKRKRQQLNEG